MKLFNAPIQKGHYKRVHLTNRTLSTGKGWIYPTNCQQSNISERNPSFPACQFAVRGKNKLLQGNSHWSCACSWAFNVIFSKSLSPKMQTQSPTWLRSRKQDIGLHTALWNAKFDFWGSFLWHKYWGHFYDTNTGGHETWICLILWNEFEMFKKTFQGGGLFQLFGGFNVPV